MSDLPNLPEKMPPPMSNGDFYLLALLHELRGMRADKAKDPAALDAEKLGAKIVDALAAPMVNLGAVVPGVDPNTEDALVDLKEPERFVTHAALIDQDGKIGEVSTGTGATPEASVEAAKAAAKAKKTKASK